jgi:hypothetical protein
MAEEETQVPEVEEKREERNEEELPSPEAAAAEDAGRAACCKCTIVHDIETMLDRPRFSQQKRYVCKGCSATEKTMVRHGMCPDKMLDESDLRQFYQAAKRARSECSDGEFLTYAKTRALIKQIMCVKTEKSFCETAGGLYKPLSMHAQDGLTKDQLDIVEKEAPKRPHPLFGWVYKVELEGESFKRVHAEVEERLVELETRAKRKKAPLAAAAQLALEDQHEAEAAAPFEELESADEEDPLVPCSSRRGRGSTKRKSAPADAEAKKALKKEKKDFQGVIAAFSKVLPRVKSYQSRWSQLLQGIGEQGLLSLPSASRESLSQIQDNVKQLETEGKKLLQHASKDMDRFPEGEEYVYRTAAELASFEKEIKVGLKLLSDFKRSTTAAGGKTSKKKKD